MAKKVQAYIKINVKAGQANPSPPIGPALGQHGVNIMDFCKSFNEKTRSIEQGSPVPVVITVYSDRSFNFVLKTPPTSFLLKKAANLKSGSSNTGKDSIGTLNRDQIAEIAKIKRVDLTAKSLSSAVRSIEGSALSMGLLVEDKKVID